LSTGLDGLPRFRLIWPHATGAIVRPKSPTALFADDDQVLGQVVNAVLRKDGWIVTVARDAMQAFMFAQRAPFDIIVLDISMPGGTGLAALEKLQMSEKTRHVPVLVVSGMTDPALPAKAVALGAFEFMPKPIDATTFPQTLRSVLDATRIMRERVLDAVGRLAKPDGTDIDAVRALMVSTHKVDYPVSAVTAALELWRAKRKIVKQQERWFVA
jgi:CheY-like chemotaxis protein